MFRFLCRLSLKMITDWKKEMLLVILGIIISSCAVIKFTDNITNFKQYYYGAKGVREEKIFYENRIHFSFKNSEKLDDIIEILKKQDGICNVALIGNAKINSAHSFPVASYSSIPILTKYDNSIGTTPDHIEDGTIVLSFLALYNLEGAGPDPVEGITETYDEGIQKTGYQVFYSCGEKFSMAGKSYQIVAENFNFKENLLSLHDSLELDQKGKLSEIELIYIYNDSFNDSQMAQVEELIRSVKPWEDTYQEKPDNTLEFSDYLEFMSNMLVGVIFAVLNALFIYQSVLKRRLPSYSVLKILGLKNFRLRIMIFLEMIIIFTISFIISVILFLLYCCATGELIYNLRYSVGYSLILLLAIYALLSIIITKRLSKRQPFEAYADYR